jgi:glyoxylase-like metal-dependent hydrolase (beta-lactamase superfamily II)
MKKIAIRYAQALLVAAAALAISALAQAQGQHDFSKMAIKTNKISNNFYTLEGQGGTIGVLTGPDGVFMVDDQFAPLTDKIVAAVKQISNNAPIKFAVNTHVHGDHTGGNENLGKLGVTILARENLRNRLMHPSPAANGTPRVPTAPVGLPLITFNNLVTFHMNGEDVSNSRRPYRWRHYGALCQCRRDYDWRFLSLGPVPNIDRINGGSLNGMIDGLGQIIARSGPNTKIIPGHGPTVDRTAVMAHRDMILAVRDRVSKLISEGRSQEDVLAATPTSDFDAKVPNSIETTQRFVTQLYAEAGEMRLRAF